MSKRIKVSDDLGVLPDEVVLEAFGFLHPKEACGLRRVCHRFNNLLSSEIGLKTMIAVCQKIGNKVYEKNLLKLVDELYKDHKKKKTDSLPETEEESYFSEYYDQGGAYGLGYSFVENGVQYNPDGTMSNVPQSSNMGREYNMYGILGNDIEHDRGTQIDGFDVVKIGKIDYLIET